MELEINLLHITICSIFSISGLSDLLNYNTHFNLWLRYVQKRNIVFQLRKTYNFQNYVTFCEGISQATTQWSYILFFLSTDYQPVCGCYNGQFWLSDARLVHTRTTSSWWVQEDMGRVWSWGKVSHFCSFVYSWMYGLKNSCTWGCLWWMHKQIVVCISCVLCISPAINGILYPEIWCNS